MLSNIGYILEHAQTAVNFDQFQIFTLLLKLPILMCSCTVVILPRVQWVQVPSDTTAAPPMRSVPIFSITVARAHKNA